MKKNILAILLIASVFSCDPSGDRYFEMSAVKKMTTGWNDEIPPVNGFLVFFVKSENNRFCMADFNDLFNFYHFDYQTHYSSFEVFVFDAINQNIVFSSSYLKKYRLEPFHLEQSIYENYNSLTLKKFISSYCESVKGDNQKFRLKDELLTTQQIYTFAYLLFINKYTCSFDDYIGTTSIRPMDLSSSTSTI